MKPYELVRLLFRARAKHDLRLVLRIFAIMMPLFILGRMDNFNISALLIVFFSAVWTTIQATFLLEYLQFHPTLMTVASES
ncbi:hypothetical protein HC02_05720 [Vibrio parahaemolyticus]|nr:hypothetical protein HC02_05720 [Vibrio parahaemolyticus]